MANMHTFVQEKLDHEKAMLELNIQLEEELEKMNSTYEELVEIEAKHSEVYDKHIQHWDKWEECCFTVTRWSRNFDVIS